MPKILEYIDYYEEYEMENGWGDTVYLKQNWDGTATLYHYTGDKAFRSMAGAYDAAFRAGYRE